MNIFPFRHLHDNGLKVLGRSIAALVLLLLVFASYSPAQTVANWQTILITGAGRPIANASVAVCQGAATTAASVASNVATLTMASNPITAGFQLSGTIIVYNFSGADAYLNGTYTITSLSSTQIQFSLTHANASATSNGAVVQQGATSATACLPLATIYTDSTGSNTTTNPTTSDGLGNVSVWAAPGVYQVQYYGSNITTKTIVMTIPGFSSGTQTQTLNGVLYVGGVLGSLWGCADINCQINAAYASIQTPSGTVPTSGTIYVIPQTGGGCYLTNTSAELTTVGKYVSVRGTVVPTITATNAITGGSCIQYTHVTATHAFDIDWTPTGGGGYMPGAGIRDLAIVNSASEGSATQCTTNGGCGSSATGIYFGNAGNGGDHAGYFENMAVKGFGVAFDMEDAGGIGWGMVIVNSSFILNTIGVQDLINVGHENTTFQGCKFAVNTTAINTTGTPGGDMTIHGGSMDSNTTGINTHTGNYIFNTTDIHWENPSVTSTVYFTGSGQLYLKGGLVLDDTNGGTNSQNFFSFTKGSMSDFTFSGGNAGRTYTGLLMNPSLAGTIHGAANGNPTAWPNLNNICPPATCSQPLVIAQNGFGNSWLLAMSTSSQGIGQPTVASIFYLRDKTTGGSAVAIVDNATPFVLVTYQIGPIAWTVTATPATGQIGLQYTSGGLQLIGHTGDTATHSVYYQQTEVQTSSQ